MILPKNYGKILRKGRTFKPGQKLARRKVGAVSDLHPYTRQPWEVRGGSQPRARLGRQSGEHKESPRCQTAEFGFYLLIFRDSSDKMQSVYQKDYFPGAGETTDRDS